MDTRDEDQETGTLPAGPPPGHGAPGTAAPRRASRALKLAGRPLALAGRPVTGRLAVGLAFLAAALLAAGVLRFGWSALLPAYCYLALVSVPLAWIDAQSGRLPDRLTLPSYPIALALLGGAALAVPEGGQHYLHALAGLAACAAFYGVLWLISPASIGLGDVKLAGVLGLYLSWFGARAVLAGLLGGFVLAAMVGVVLIAARRATRKTHIPFGPFMLAAALAVLLTPALSG
ncbi:MAG TPA: A24 family peptidase [Streptosporangiaceae bacterium]